MLVKQIIDLIKKIGFHQLFKIIKFNKDTIKYARSYMACYSISALSNIGFFDELKDGKSIDLSEFSKRKSLDYRILLSVCDYLYILNILDKANQTYKLSKHGTELLDRSIGTFDFLHAYAPLFENLDSLLTKRSQYQVNIFRRGDFVAKATAEVSKYIPIPVVKDIILRNNFKTVLDLGCGSADFLLQLCNNSVSKCYGIDISQDAIRFAQVKINQSNMQQQVHVQVGNIFNVHDLKNISNEIDVITCMFVLHEFLNEGKDKIITLLKTLKQAFPHQSLLICEFSRFSPEDLRGSSVSIAEHHLFHALSNQGILTVPECRSIFIESGYRIVEEIRYDFSGQAYFLLK